MISGSTGRFSRLFMVYGRDGIDGNDGMGRDGKTVVQMEPWSRPVPSRRQFHLPLAHTVPSRRENLSRCTLPSRPVEEIAPYRPVPSRKYPLTVPSRRQNLPLPSRPVCKTYPYRPIPSSKPTHTVPSRRQNLSIPSNLAVRTCPYCPAPPYIAVTPSRQDAVTSRCREYYEHCLLYTSPSPRD